MIINKLTQETFNNRKEAKEKMGHAAYNKAVKDNIFIYKESDIIL